MAETLRRFARAYLRPKPPPVSASTERKRLFDISDEPHPKGLLYDTIDGRPTIYPHVKQKRVLMSRRGEGPPPRFVVVLSGVRSGKTSAGPFWMTDVMQDQGPGLYLLIAPNFPLLEKAAVLDVQDVMGRLLGLGNLNYGARGYFAISPEGHRKLWPDIPYNPLGKQSRLIFGYASKPESLAAVTAKAAWIDECGQRDFKHDSHLEIQARVSTTTGPILYTSRPYQPGWFKELCDQAETEPNTELIHYESRDNPTFSAEEWDRQERILPGYKFNIMYRGVFDRPAGAVYDCFRDDGADTHVRPGGDVFKVPPDWPIKCGIDFGAPNFAAVFSCEVMELPGPLQPGRRSRLQSTGEHWIFAEYRPAESCTVADHVKAMLEITGGRVPTFCAGGSGSEQWLRDEFGAAGWPISPPNQTDVEVGIGRVYEGFATRRLFVFDNCVRLIADIKSYSRAVDEAGNVLNEIEDKDTFHSADALRYLCNYLFETGPGFTVLVL